MKRVGAWHHRSQGKICLVRKKKKSGARFWQSCLASLPHGSDQEEKKQKINRQNTGKQESPLEMNENSVPQKKAHLLYVSSGDL